MLKLDDGASWPDWLLSVICTRGQIERGGGEVPRYRHSANR